MQDLQRARQLLCEQDFTCVLCRGERVYTSRKTGISPMLDWIMDGEDLAGYAAADRIVGKAAAMLFDLAGIRTLHAQVLSEPALQYLKSRNIDVSYDTLTLHIINRHGDGICPMERAAAGISDAQEALRILYDTRERLRQGEKHMKKLGFGFMRLPLLDGSDQTSFDKEQLCRMVDAFLEQGFTYFDTAYMYHNGASERVLKEVLTDRHPRESFLLADKLPTMFLKEEADMERIFQEQLEKTGAGYFDYYLLHCLNQENYATSQRLGAFEFVVQKKEQGLVRKIGFSYHDKAQLLDEILTAHPEVEFVQLQINYLDWENAGIQSRKCYEVARKHGKEILVMEPVKGGTLAKVPPAAEKLLRSHEPELSIPSWAIRFAASLEGVSMVLSGMSNLEQLMDNTAYMRDFQPLTAEETALCMQVTDIINEKIAVPCTACRYCVEGCPVQIAIPDYFELYNAELQEIKKNFTVQGTYYDNLILQNGKASDCIGCGQCEQHCPQHIDIIDMLKKVAEAFE